MNLNEYKDIFSCFAETSQIEQKIDNEERMIEINEDPINDLAHDADNDDPATNQM